MKSTRANRTTRVGRKKGKGKLGITPALVYYLFIKPLIDLSVAFLRFLFS